MKYIIRKATIKDVGFLAKVIIEAEKSTTNTLGLATLFDLTEEEIKKYVISMLKEEVDGCEFSISSFFVASYGEEAVAALGGWLEGYYDGLSSTLLKSNLIQVTFPKVNINNAFPKFEIIKDIQYEREMGAYQIEYTYVERGHRGTGLSPLLMKAHLEQAKKLDPNTSKVQVQPFENNKIIIKLHELGGYKIVRRYVSQNEEIFKYMPHNVKVLMEKSL